ncbi:MAG: insulinase family protein, partial [Bacteroidota bacterium]
VAMAWNVPEWGNKEFIHLDLVTDVLARGKNSRLYKKLVYEDQSASGASAFSWPKEIASNIFIQANVKPGVELETVENTVNEVLMDFIKNGPTKAEMARIKAQYFSSFIKGIERIGGFGGKSDILAQHEVYGGSPDHYKKILNMVHEATAEDLRKAAEKWLSKGRHTLVCNPFPEYSTSEPAVDRSKGLPEMGPPATAKFPTLQKATLKNGMEVVLAKREGVPTVIMDMMFDAGYASDQMGKPGTASLAMSMMDEGTKTKDALAINNELSMMGAGLSAYSDLDMSYVSMNTLKPSFEQSLDLYSDVILNPAFPQNEFDRLKSERLNGIKREKSNPVQMALRVFPKYLYGEDHAYSLPFTGSGFESTVSSMTRDDVTKFYKDWIKPNNATLIVVGDFEMEELLPMVEQKFGNWKKGKTPKKNIAQVKEQAKSTLYLMDRPESQQSVIIGGYLIEPYGDISEIARQTSINILGGEFTSRLNMNLREDKHWAYGAYTFNPQAKGQRPLMAYAPVQTDKTKESVQEILKEFEQFSGDQPITQEEFDKTTNNTILQLPGQWETNNAVMGSVNNVVKYGLKDDYYQKYDQMVRDLSLEDVRKLSKKLVRPKDLSFFVVGDKEKILPGLKELGFDEVILVDPDGNPVTGAAKAKP